MCGNTTQACSDFIDTHAQYESHGAATQYFQVGRGVNPNGCLRPDNTTCFDYTFNRETCCSSRRCEVVALPSRTFDLIDAGDPAAGGVVLRHVGYPDQSLDDLRCPEQEPGLPRLRQFILSLACDPFGAIDDLTVTSYDEVRLRAPAQ